MKRTAFVVTLSILPLAGLRSAAGDDADLQDILQSGKSTTAPSGELSPQADPQNDPLGTRKDRAARGARIGVITLSTGKKYEGRIWTTLETPLRLWIEERKTYQDIDFSLIRRVDVVVQSEQMEDDWRWLKEGSDQKVYSGKKYPNVELAYKVTLSNEQVVEGTTVAPIYVFDGDKNHSLALYKKYKGKLDETLKDLVYIKSISLRETGDAVRANEGKTTKLPLIVD